MCVCVTAGVVSGVRVTARGGQWCDIWGWSVVCVCDIWGWSVVCVCDS